MRKAYLDTPNGQIHARFWHEDKPGLPLLSLPPAPHSGLYFMTLAEHLNHPMIAVDYPGTGGSSPLDVKPAIEDYARIIGGLLPKIGKVNLMGFHSGCLVALEMTKRFNAQIEYITCIDFPYFEAVVRKKYLMSFSDVEPPKKPNDLFKSCLLYTSPSPRDATLSRMPSSA